jgi:hypothetical protein
LNPHKTEANQSRIHRNQKKLITTKQARARKKEKTPHTHSRTQSSNPNRNTRTHSRHAETSPPTNQDSASEKDRQAEHTRIRPTILYLTLMAHQAKEKPDGERSHRVIRERRRVQLWGLKTSSAVHC